MGCILILTRNVLSESKLQEELQQMNYEVLISTNIYTQLQYHIPMGQVLSYFQLVIFSEYLTDNEITQVLPKLVESDVPLMQRVNQNRSVLTNQSWRKDNTVFVSETTASSQVFREQIESLLCEKSQDEYWVDYYKKEEWKEPEKTNIYRALSFSRNDWKILEILYQADGKLVTKEDLSELVWNQPLNKSRMVQIYTSIGHIKEKLQGLQPEKILIGTQRGRGYFLTEHFYQYFTLDDLRYDISDKQLNKEF